MFSRVLKTTNAQPPAHSDTSNPPASPAKSRSSHVKAQSTSAAPPSPSKIPVPVGGSRSAFQPSKENKDSGGNGNSYLSFLFSNNSSSATNSASSGASTPVKVNKGITQSSNPAVTHGSHATTNHSSVPQPPAHTYARIEPTRAHHDEDVHMQTLKNTVNPAMLKQLASIPQGIQQVLPVASRPAPALPARMMMHQSEDVHMRTQRNETRAGERGGLQLWERELLESAEVRRKATVAQICELRAPP
jgi:non-specific serine/threonine protein kinase